MHRRFLVLFTAVGSSQALQKEYEGGALRLPEGHKPWTMAVLTCKKYLPSVQRSASVIVTTAWPALPVNPEIQAMRSKQGALYSHCKRPEERSA